MKLIFNSLQEVFEFCDTYRAGISNNNLNVPEVPPLQPLIITNKLISEAVDGSNKINVIKAVRAITRMKLKEAQGLVEYAIIVAQHNPSSEGPTVAIKRSTVLNAFAHSQNPFEVKENLKVITNWTDNEIALFLKS